MEQMTDKQTEEEVRKKLALIKDAPDRDILKAAHQKAAYLMQMKDIINESLIAHPVSVSPVDRLINWITRPFGELQTNRKERFSMMTIVTSVLVAIALLFGGAGATVYAAQDSLPDEVLYPVKTFTEDFRLNLSVNPLRRIDLALGFSDERIEEIITLHASGEPIPPDVMLRLYNQLNLALRLASGLDDAELATTLQEIGIHIRQQDRDMVQGRTNMPEGVDPSMEQVRAILRLQAGLADDGVVNPTQFRLRLRPNQVVVTDTPVVTDPVSVTDLPALLVSETPVPGAGFGPGPGDGPGNVDCPECTPVYDGSGPGPGPGPANNGDVVQPTEGYGPGYGPLGTPYGPPLWQVTPQPGGNGKYQKP